LALINNSNDAGGQFTISRGGELLMPALTETDEIPKAAVVPGKIHQLGRTA
jgi:hypothetical protein